MKEIRKGECGNTPKIGDMIAFNPPRYKGLIIAEVVAFSDSGLPRVKGDCPNNFYMALNNDGTYTPKTGFVVVNIKETKSEVEIAPKGNYKLTVRYHLGDSFTQVNRVETISLDNPFLPILLSGLGKLETPEDRTGIVLNSYTYWWNLNRNKITQSEFDLLTIITECDFYDDCVTYKFLKALGFECDGDKIQENIEFLMEFEGVLAEDTEYTYLVYQGFNLV